MSICGQSMRWQGRTYKAGSIGSHAAAVGCRRKAVLAMGAPGPSLQAQQAKASVGVGTWLHSWEAASSSMRSKCA